MENKPNPTLPGPVVDAIEAAVNEAMGLYEIGHALDESMRSEAREDFRRFYLASLRRGYKGIRWNFGGCLLCPDQEGPVLCTRILVLGKRLLAKTHGRPLGADVCDTHLAQLSTDTNAPRVLEKAALRRIRRDPLRT